MSKFYMQYISGCVKQQMPQLVAIKTDHDGIKLFKQAIRWSSMTNVEVKHDVANNGFSVGKAIAGDMLAGGIGALVGGMSGKTKVNTFIQVSYKAAGQPYELLLMTRGSDRKAQLKFINLLMKESTKKPATTLPTTSKQPIPEGLSFSEKVQLRKDELRQQKVEREQRTQEKREQLGLTPEAIAARKAQTKERNERQKEQLRNLAAAPGKLLAKLRQK